MINLNRDWKEFIESLNSNRVEYVIVGALALAAHGRPRYTGDMDVLIRPELENASRVLAALREFGFRNLDLNVSDFMEPGQVVQLGVPPRRIDILTAITGCSFDEAWVGRLEITVDAVSIPILGKAQLILNKTAAGRRKDLADLEDLRP